MLDFYLIQDNQSKPNFPEQVDLEFIGGLDGRTFENLKNKGIIDDRFYYYSDFRWGTSTIQQISDKVNLVGLEKDNDIKILANLLERARLKNSGLIAYGD